MASSNSRKPVVVGIDGSISAIHAAQWAHTEASSRRLPMRLVHVAQVADTDEGPDVAIEYGQQSLRDACAAIAAPHQSVEIETRVALGDAADALIDESRSASMVVLGSVGIDPVAEHLLGSTAAEVAREAKCSVAVLRRNPERSSGVHGSVVVPMRAAGNDDAAIDTALDEARRRRLSIIVVGVWREDYGDMPYEKLDAQIARWQKRFPAVDMEAIATRSSLPAYLAACADAVSVVVIGEQDLDQFEKIIGLGHHPLIGQGDYCVLVARPEHVQRPESSTREATYAGHDGR